MCQEEVKHEVAETKKCSICGEVLPLDMFLRRGAGREMFVSHVSVSKMVNLKI